MEPLTIFAAAVAFIGIFHLLAQVADKLRKNSNARITGTNRERSDWYCFFNMSDLYGNASTPSRTREKQRVEKQDEKILEQKRRQQAQRPRLHA